MSLFDGAEVLTIDDLSKGIDAYGDVTGTEKGCYPEADNLVLTRKNPSSILGTTRFSTIAAPGSETILYAVSFTLVGSSTEKLVYTSGGTWYRLASDTYTQLRTGLSTAPTYLSHAPFRGRMILANGVDAIQGYDGTTMFPVGGKMVSNCSNTPTPAGTWTGGTEELTLVREGTGARRMTQSGAATFTLQLAYTSTQDFLAGPNSGDPNFDAAASGDTLRAQVNVVTGAANITSLTFRFHTTAGVDYRTSASAHAGLVAGWNAISLTRNGFTDTGAPNWASIVRVDVIMVTSGDATIVVDDLLFQYGTNPVPVGNIVVVYNNFLIVGDQSADRVRLNYSSVTQIDDFPTANFARVTAGGYSLEQGDRITALHVYTGVVIIGKPRSIHALSGAPSNISVDAVTTETGIDGHNSVVESPYALLYVYGNAVQAFRLTGREAVSQRIAPMLMTTNHGGIGPGLDLDNAQAHTAIRHDETHTIRYSFREIGTSTNALQMVYDWVRNAWTSELLYNPRHYHHAIVSSAREIHFVAYDGFIRRADVGTDFDGTAIASRLLLPWVAGPRERPEDVPAMCEWLGAVILLDGNVNVVVEYRTSSTPSGATGAFSAAEGSPLSASSANAEQGLVGFGNVVGRFLQIRLRTTSGSMEVHPPIYVYYKPIPGRVGA